MYWYEVLGVNKNDSSKVIEKAYKALMKKHHPDRNPQDPERATKKTQEITSAYEQACNYSDQKLSKNLIPAKTFLYAINARNLQKITKLCNSDIELKLDGYLNEGLFIRATVKLQNVPGISQEKLDQAKIMVLKKIVHYCEITERTLEAIENISRQVTFPVGVN